MDQRNRSGGLSARPPGPRRTPAVRRVRPGLEVLEDRTVPTVAFRPQAAGEVVVNDGSQNTALTSASVYLLFEGAYWGSAAGSRDEATITADALKILNSPFLSGLSQYTPSHGDVRAALAGTYRDTAPLPANFAPPLPDGGFDWTALNARLQSALADPGSGVPAFAADTPIYVILTDPEVPSGAGWVGYNETTAATGNRRQVWTTVDLRDPSGAFDEDAFTLALSHELVESMSGSVRLNLPAAYAGLGNQVADGEPGAGPGYGYRLNGVLVQPYWSDQDQAFIVPDGNRQQFTLEAATAGLPGPARYRLSVRGDQLGTASDDQVLIDRGAWGGVRVALNGELAQFDAGAISSITLSTGGGRDVVKVAPSAAGFPVAVTWNGAAPFKFVEADGGTLYTSAPTVWKGDVNGDHRRDLVLEVYDPVKGLIARVFLSKGGGKVRTVDALVEAGSPVSRRRRRRPGRRQLQAPWPGRASGRTPRAGAGEWRLWVYAGGRPELVWVPTPPTP